MALTPMSPETLELIQRGGKKALDVLEEMDRNARAYAWEVGNGAPLKSMLDRISPENPFRDPNWRDKVVD